MGTGRWGQPREGVCGFGHGNEGGVQNGLLGMRGDQQLRARGGVAMGIGEQGMEEGYGEKRRYSIGKHAC